MKRLTLVLLIFVTTILSGCVEKEPDFPVYNINDPRFAKDIPQDILNKFTISEDGIIMDGPRQAEGEPIDYSALLSHDEKVAMFVRSVFTTDSRSGAFNKDTLRIFKMDASKDVGMFLSVEEGLDRDYIQSTLDEVLVRISAATGLEFKYNLGPEHFPTIFVSVGSKKYLNNLRLILMEDSRRAKSIDATVPKENLDFCDMLTFLLNQKRLDGLDQYISQLTIFINPKHLTLCMNDLTYRGLGVSRLNDKNISSMLTAASDYKLPTKIDYDIIRILYSDNITINSSKENIIKIAEQAFYK